MDPLLESPPLRPGSTLEGDGAAHHACPEPGSFQTKHERAGSTGSCRVTCWKAKEEECRGAAQHTFPHLACPLGDIQVAIPCLNL